MVANEVVNFVAKLRNLIQTSERSCELFDPLVVQISGGFGKLDVASCGLT